MAPVGAKLVDELTHLGLIDDGGCGPLSDSRSPVLLWSAGVPRCHVDVQVRDHVADDEAIDMLHVVHSPESRSGMVDHDSEPSGLLIRKLAESRYMSLGLDHQVPPVRRRSIERVNVTDVDQVILVEHAA